MRLARVVLVACLAVGCGAAPAATPEGMDAVIANLVTRDFSVLRPVSGDSGCPEQELHDNAVRFYVSAPDEDLEQLVYLFRWRRMPDFDAARSDFESCVAAYQQSHPGAELVTLESAPWRAYGPDWTPATEAAIRDALHQAGGR